MSRQKNVEKMYLNTLGKNEMYLSVAEILGTDIDMVRKYILQSMSDIIDWNYDEHSIDKMNIAGLLKECGCKKLKRIDSMIVSHITPRKSIDSVWKEGLMTLPHVLTKKTILSDYLQKLGFEFSFDNKKIIMKRNGEIVDVEKLDFSNLKMRFGGEKTLNDFNVNGYLFIDEFELVAVRGWLGSPEILKSLANSYRKNSIADNYADRCINYYVSFEVPIEKVDIEGFPDWLDEDRKTEILLKYTINALAYEESKRKPYLPMYNPIIMLKRNYDVPGSDIRKVWRLDYKGSKFVPVDDV
jgi:hypothetical protein